MRTSRLSRHLLLFVVGAAFSTVESVRASTIYDNQATFLSALGNSFTDDYNGTTYGWATNPDVGEVVTLTDSQMTNVVHETTYSTDGLGIFVVGAQSGTIGFCNCLGDSNFTLGFTSTTVGSSAGVYGFGFEYFDASASQGNIGVVTFSDGSTQDIALPLSLHADTFFGLTSNIPVRSFSFVTDPITDGTIFSDLTIGAAPVPLPASAWLLISGLGGLGIFRMSAKRRTT